MLGSPLKQLGPIALSLSVLIATTSLEATAQGHHNLQAGSQRPDHNTFYQLVPHGQDEFSIQSTFNHLYVEVSRGSSELQVGSTRPDHNTHFIIESLGGGKYALKSTFTGKYVRVLGDNTLRADAENSEAQSARFRIRGDRDRGLALQSVANSLWVENLVPRQENPPPREDVSIELGTDGIEFKYKGFRVRVKF